jgi:hypothetical protein
MDALRLGREKGVSQQTQELSQSAWHDYFESVTREHQGTDVTIEVLSRDFGDELEVEHMPFAYLEYDHKDDVVNVGVGGRDGRYPVVMRHAIEHPKAILADRPGPDMPVAIEIVGDDGAQTIISLHRPVAST